MIQSRQEATDELRRALARAAAAGVPHDVIERMATEPMTLNQVATELLDADADCPEPDDDFAQCEIIYEPGQLPDGLIDLPSAAKQENIPLSTLRTWVQLGKIPRRGRLKAPAAGGGYVVTERTAILHARDNPRKPGPKPKTKPPSTHS